MGFLRLWLAIIVVTGHVSTLTLAPKAAILAVEIFFMISGFYMQLVLGDYIRTGKGWITNFYISRLWRLMPLYYAILFATLAFAMLAPGTPLPASFLCRLNTGTMATCTFSNLFVIGQDILRLAIFDFHDGTLHFFSFVENRQQIPAYSLIFLEQSWSLAPELMFYALVPFLLRGPTKLLVLILAASLLLKVIIISSPLPASNADWNFAFFPAEIGVFLLGSLACRYGHGIRLKILPYFFQFWQTRSIVFFLLIAALCICLRYGSFILFGMTFLFLPALFQRQSKLDTWAGHCSYPIYMTHMLSIHLLKATGWTTEGYIIAGALLMSAFIAVAYCVLIDIPVTHFRHARFRKAHAEEFS